LPQERKRLRGTYRRDRDRRPAEQPLEIVAGVDTIPEPYRPLGEAGQRFWTALWSFALPWLAPCDTELVLMTAEAIDERTNLMPMAAHSLVFRRQLRLLDKQLTHQLSLLGLTPADRSKLGVAEVRARSAMQAIIERGQNRRHAADPS
jgi:hypothetical protein